MAFQLDVPFNRSFTVPGKDAAALFAFFSDFPNAITPHFPGVESFDARGEQTYHWRFEELAYKAFRLTIEFDTKFELQAPRQISMIPTGPSPHRLEGKWTFSDVPGGGRCDFQCTVSVEAPAPSLLKSVVTPFAKKGLTDLFGKYFNNVEQALGK